MDIALLVDTKTEWHRGILTGIAQYSSDVGHWRFQLAEPNDQGEISLPKHWNGDGIICRITSQHVLNEIAASGKPAVNVSWLNNPSPNIANVVSDEAGCARLAADFFIDKRYNNFGYIGFPPWKNYSDILETTLRQIFLENRNHCFFSFPLANDPRLEHGIEPEKFRAWLMDLPKPIGIVVWDSAVGHLLTRMCHQKNVHIPNEVSIVCVEHDSLWSALATVPLSNIDQDPWRVGYEAARLLRSKILDERGADLKISPITIVERLSTKASAVKDPVLTRALEFIYPNVDQGLTVAEVADYVGISRRGLEVRFKNGLDCSPASFIRRLQIQSVARLLRTTSLTIKEIAGRTGFNYPEVLMRAFKREYGVTPRIFRGQNRPKFLDYGTRKKKRTETSS